MQMKFKTLFLVLSAGALALAIAQAAPSEETLADTEMAVGEAESDSLDTPPIPQSRADSVVLIRHQFNHREQIIAGGVVMACIAVMMAVMNNYNPR